MKKRIAFIALFVSLLAIMLVPAAAYAADGLTVTLKDSSQSFEYKAEAYTPEVEVKSGSTLLTKEIDYTVVYQNNTNAGTATIEVTGIGTYKDQTGKLDFTIGKATLGRFELDLPSEGYYYNGSGKRPFVTAYTTTGVLLTKNDYSVDYKNNTNAGAAVVIVKPNGSNCQGDSLQKEFTINKVHLDLTKLRLSQETYYYNGTARTPSVTVVDTLGTVLRKDTDYKIEYTPNILPGKVTVTVTPDGTNCFDSPQKLYFTILPAEVSSVSISSTSFEYTGKAIEPDVTVKDNTGRLLIKGDDYTLSYSNNTKVGTATITATGKSSNHCTGTATKTFTIKGKLSSATLDSDTYYYDGSAKTPDVTVKGVDGATLTKNTDYSVSYSNNTKVGTATATITGKGNYTGTITKEFSIKGAQMATVTLASTSLVYNGKAQEPAVTVKDSNGKTLTKNTDYTVTYASNTNAGKATVTVTGKGNYSGTKKVEFTITAAALGTMTLAQTAYDYDGQAKQPDVTVKDSAGATLKKDTDYTIKYKNNTNRGTATATVTGKGNYSGTLQATFTINGKTQQMVVKASTKTVKVKKLKKKAQTVSPIKVTDSHGKLTYTKKSGASQLKIDKATGKVTVKKKAKKGTYTMTVKVKAAGDVGYKPGTETVEVKIIVK